MACSKNCDNNCETVVKPNRGGSNYLIIVVLYILLAIILGSLIIY